MSADIPDVPSLRVIRSQCLALIAELTLQPKPSYQLEGQSVSWSEYLARLKDVVEWCDVKLAEAEPFEMRSRAVT
ncbi:MAG: hypothetical protein GYA33_15390 [Thermogutta sp.]|nr:hypothetical protein [Thermogutta sp.]